MNAVAFNHPEQEPVKLAVVPLVDAEQPAIQKQSFLSKIKNGLRSGVSQVALTGKAIAALGLSFGNATISKNTYTKENLAKAATSVGTWLRDPHNYKNMIVNFAVIGGTKIAAGSILAAVGISGAAAIPLLALTTGVASGLLKTRTAYLKAKEEGTSTDGLWTKTLLKNIGVSASFGLAGGLFGYGLGSGIRDLFAGTPSMDATHALAAAPAAAVGVDQVMPDAPSAPAPVAAPEAPVAVEPVAPAPIPEVPVEAVAAPIAPADPLKQFETLIANDADVKPSVLKDLAVAQDVNASDAARSHAMANLSYYSLHGKAGVSIDHATAYALSKEALELNPDNTGAQQFKDYMETNTEVGKAAHAAEVQAKIENFVPDAKPLNLAFEGNVTDILENGSNQQKMALAHALFNGDANYTVDGQPMPIQSSPKDAVAILKDLAADGYKPAQVALDKLPGDLDSYKTSRLPENVSSKIAELTAPPVVEAPAGVAAVEPTTETKSTPISARHAADCNVDPTKPREALCKVFKPEMENGNYVTATNIQNGQSMTVMLNAGENEVVPTDGFMKRTLTRSWNALMSALGGTTPDTMNAVASAAAPAPKI